MTPSATGDSFGDNHFMELYRLAGYQPNILFRSNDIESILMMVAAEEGISILPSYVTSKLADADNLVFIPLVGEGEYEKIISVWKKKGKVRRSDILFRKSEYPLFYPAYPEPASCDTEAFFLLQPAEHTEQHRYSRSCQHHLRRQLRKSQSVQRKDPVQDIQRRDLQHDLAQDGKHQGFFSHAACLEDSHRQKVYAQKRQRQTQSVQKTAAICNDGLIFINRPMKKPEPV